MSRNDYEEHDGLGLAERVRRGETTPAELLDAALARSDARNPALNAVVTPLADAARREVAAGLPTGPFTGVPFLVKELVASVAGAATTAASRLYRDNIAKAELPPNCQHEGDPLPPGLDEGDRYLRIREV